MLCKIKKVIFIMKRMGFFILKNYIIYDIFFLLKNDYVFVLLIKRYCIMIIEVFYMFNLFLRDKILDLYFLNFIKVINENINIMICNLFCVLWIFL